MKRDPFVAVQSPTGNTFHVTRHDAYMMVKCGDAHCDDLATLRNVRIVPELVIRGLSCRVGSYLANAVRSRADWALVMMRQIRGQIEAGV